MKKNYAGCLLYIVSLSLISATLKGQVSLTTLNTAYTVNFDVLLTTGAANPWTDNTTLTGWYAQFSATPANPTTYRADGGGSNQGAIYSWGVAGVNPITERAFGSVSTGTPVTISRAIRLVNNTGSAIASLTVSFTGEQWRDAGAVVPVAQKLDFQYQVANAGVITDANTPSTGWVDHNALDFTSPTFVNTGAGAALDGNLGANRTAISSNITVTVNSGQEIWLRWQDINDGGNDHGLAIDDLSVTPLSTILDIRLGNFTAKNKGRTNLITWTNYTEDAGDIMEVQSSSDGNNFTTIGTVRARGVNNASYEYEDNNPVSGVNYYRLKLTNASGLSTYSIIVRVVTVGRKTVMIVYPNPAHNSLVVACGSDGELKIINVTGQVVWTGKLQSGSNHIDISSLPSGLYQAKYNYKTISESTRFIKN